ncbi:Arrestin domain-containing protein 3, partial [Oryzias melastigma]
NNTVSKGSHVYPFTFQIPTEERPSSFRGAFGKIVYRVEANLSRSKRKDKKAKAEFIVINKGQRDPALMSPQQGMVNTKKKVMSSGTITMDCYVDVKFGGGPEFKFNIVVLPVTEGSEEEKTSAYDGSDMLPVSFMSEGGSLFQ